MSHSDIVNIVTSDLTENTENDETDSFSDGGDLGCLSAGTGWFRIKSINLGVNTNLFQRQRTVPPMDP